MRCELLLPYQLREARQQYTNCAPIGVIEYHGEHMAMGWIRLP